MLMLKLYTGRVLSDDVESLRIFRAHVLCGILCYTLGALDSSWRHMAHTVSGSPWLIAPFWQRQGSVPVTPSSPCGPLSRLRVSSYDPHDDPRPTHNTISNTPDHTWIPDRWDCCGVLSIHPSIKGPTMACEVESVWQE